MTRKLSNWSKPGEKPPMVGVWMTDFYLPPRYSYQYWDGNEWRCAAEAPGSAHELQYARSVCNPSTVRFRGLADRPEWMMLTTTLNRIRAHSPCKSGWEKLLRGLDKSQADDEPLPYADILRINGLDDALWCCRAEPQYSKEWRLYAVWCARQVQHLMKDQRSVAALDVAERHAHGQATDDELAAAREAAREAARDATWAAQAAEFLRVVGQTGVNDDPT